MAPLLTRVVAAFEAFSSRPYKDAGGRPTIGYGHLIKEGEIFPDAISREDALQILEADISVARRAVDNLFRGVFLAAHELDALTSFTFNVGSGAVGDSTLRKRVLAGDRRAAASEFLRWIHTTRPDGAKLRLAGLIRRRDVESVWFLGADPATVTRLAGALPEEAP